MGTARFAGKGVDGPGGMAGKPKRRRPRAGSESGACRPGTDGMKTPLKSPRPKKAQSQVVTAVPRIGFVERFRPGDYTRVEKVIADIRALGVHEMRTIVSWADWYSSEGDGWYAWLLPTLAKT